MRSESATGMSIVWVDIKSEYKEMRPIWDKLRRKVDRAREELPSGIIGPRVDDEFGDVFGIQAGDCMVLVGSHQGIDQAFAYLESRD